MDTAKETFSPVRVGEHFWIPLHGMKVGGKHNITCQQLSKTAFGLDLSGVAVAHSQKGSVLPTIVEVVNKHSLMVIRAIVPEEVGRGVRPVTRQDISRTRPRNSKTGFAGAGGSINKSYSSLEISYRAVKGTEGLHTVGEGHIGLGKPFNSTVEAMLFDSTGNLIN